MENKKRHKSLYSLNFAKKSMREALSLNMENELEVALERYVFMHDFLKPAEKTKHKLSRKEKKLKKASTKLKQNYGKLKKTFLSKSENRIDTKDFQKQLKKNIKETKKVLKVVTNLDQETDKFYVSINRLFEQSLDFLDNCQPDCKKKDLVTLIDAIKLNENLLKEIEPKLLKNNIHKIWMD